MKIYSFLTNLKFQNYFFSIIASASLMISALTVQACHWGYIYSGNDDIAKTLLLFIMIGVVVIFTAFSYAQKIRFLRKNRFFGNKNKRVLSLIFEGIITLIGFSLVIYSHNYSFNDNSLLFIFLPNGFKVNITPFTFGFIFAFYHIINVIIAKFTFSKSVDKYYNSKIFDLLNYDNYRYIIFNLEASKNIFSCIVIALRKQLSLSQSKFAALLGVTYSTVSTWEKGKHIPGTEILAKFRNKFGIIL